MRFSKSHRERESTKVNVISSAAKVHNTTSYTEKMLIAAGYVPKGSERTVIMLQKRKNEKTPGGNNFAGARLLSPGVAFFGSTDADVCNGGDS